MGEWKDNEGSGVEETDVPSMTSGRWNPANRPRTPGFAITEDEDESTEDLPKTPIGCNRSNQPFGPVDIIPFRAKLSSPFGRLTLSCRKLQSCP